MILLKCHDQIDPTTFQCKMLAGRLFTSVGREVLNVVVLPVPVTVTQHHAVVEAGLPSLLLLNFLTLPGKCGRLGEKYIMVGFVPVTA